jgi:DNA gyrase subunit A
MITERGTIIRFNEKEVRPMGRNTRGVRGISLKKEDYVVGMDVIEEGCNLLIITEQGFGKNTRLKEYRAQHRGGHGIIAMKLRAKKGSDKIARAKMVMPDDDILIITKNGNISRQKVNKISTQRRAAKGVRVQRLDADDKIVDIAVVINEKEDEETKE